MAEIHFDVDYPGRERTRIKVSTSDPSDCKGDVQRAIRQAGMDPNLVNACVRVG